MTKNITTILIAVISVASIYAQEKFAIPKSYANLSYDSTGTLIFTANDGTIRPSVVYTDNNSLSSLRSIPVGTKTSIEFDFRNSDMSGWLYYGQIQTADIKHSYPMYFHRRSRIDSGKTEINIIENLAGLFDITGWEKSKLIRLGYRIVNDAGDMLYDGKILVSANDTFKVVPSIIEGPFVNLLTHHGATISFVTSVPIKTEIIIDGDVFGESVPSTHHEIMIDKLKADKDHEYTIHYGEYQDTYSFHTAPKPGSRKPFTFAYASDGRGNAGGGERDIKGTNAYIIKRIAVLSSYKNARFFQFTGDMIDGYDTSMESMQLEYANWKRVIEPFAHYIPFVTGMGNHEGYWYYFRNGKKVSKIDQFPFMERSAEVLYAKNFVNPVQGPFSEDGAAYDPDPNSIDFPPYAETIFHYIYDNVAIIVLNADYWLSTTIAWNAEHGGNLHGYIMDNQLDWLRSTLQKLENNDDIDHVFVTQHTPVFPNGGHLDDDMWWNGDNSKRPYVAGKPVAKGIIENRDEYLDIIMNNSSKVLAVLTSDEHNYHRMHLTADTPIYPENYDKPKLTKYRPLTFITNGTAGAPYYGREMSPWADWVDKFSSQYAVVFIHVDGKKVWCEVINPDTMELIETFTLTE
ncbi:MAG: metallophosphoesterase [Candidatus Neomarinimicrobiota bacterium]